MRLMELRPRWVTEHMLIFICPHCHKAWLTVTTKAISIGDQFESYYQMMKTDTEGFKLAFIPARPGYQWEVTTRDVRSMTVTPPLDNLGHWRGNITDGGCL